MGEGLQWFLALLQIFRGGGSAMGGGGRSAI